MQGKAEKLKVLEEKVLRIWKDYIQELNQEKNLNQQNVR